MSRDDSVLAVDQDGSVEAKCFDAASDRHHLLATMNSRIKRISRERIHGHRGDSVTGRLYRSLFEMKLRTDAWTSLPAPANRRRACRALPVSVWFVTGNE
jgi:hypothetical protein